MRFVHRARQPERRIYAYVMLAAVLGGLACTEETVVFRDRAVFNPPPDQASGFLGYFDRDTKLTTCGNCHVGRQAGWVGTKHARAYEDLAASPAAQSFCVGCHGVSELGNAVSAPAGWNAVPDSAYLDVQCESCHGPGLDHVENPDATQPLAAVTVLEVDANNDTTFINCGECHSGIHQPFVEEWSVSPHGGVVSSAASNASCQACHQGQGTLKAWGENADYIEKTSATPLAVVCAVCHDPHDATNHGQLRFPVETTSIEEHLCARCHNRRTEPSATSAHGLEPHAPESALLVGDAGWFPPGGQINQGQIRGTHGTDRNPTLCAQCHIAGFTVTDAETGAFQFQATGHLFRPIPCLDTDPSSDRFGQPLPFENGCGLSTAERSYQACTASGCHGDATAAFSALTTAVGRIQRWTDSLLVLLTKVDPNLEAAGGEIDPTVATFTVAEGAFFNYNLAVHGNQAFGTNTVVGSTAHNPFLTEGLLLASIDAVEQQYAAILFPAGRPPSDMNARIQALLAKVPE